MANDLTGGLPDEREYLMVDCPDQPDIRDTVNVWIEEENGLFGMRISVEAAHRPIGIHTKYISTSLLLMAA